MKEEEMTRAGTYQNLTDCFSAVFLRLSYVLLRKKKREGREKGFETRINGFEFMCSSGVTFY